MTDDDYWTFRVTRTVWAERDPAEVRMPRDEGGTWTGGDEKELLVLGILLIGVPLAIDLVLLPVTLTHDLLYVH